MPEDRPPRLRDVRPVLAVSDLMKSLDCWQELGFSLSWVWGEPPQIGQVARDGVGVVLEQNPTLAATAEGRSVLISVQNIEALYALHQQKADILVPLGISPFGSREYTVREINGYHLRFSAPPAPVSRSKTLPPTIQIVERAPTVGEYLQLSNSVGWTGITPDRAAQNIAEACFALTAQETNTGNAVGSLFLLTVGANDFYIKDVMVHPDWQGQRVGTTLLQTLMRWFQENAVENAQVSLHTDENATAPFYASLGFTPHFGMSLRNKKNDGAAYDADQSTNAAPGMRS